MRSHGLILLSFAVLSSSLPGCTSRRTQAPARPTPNASELELALGRTTFSETCASCHTIAPPPRSAPPMSHIARHYRAATPDTGAAIQQIADWIAAPSASASALPGHAVQNWGLMPPLPLSLEKRLAVARYVVSLDSTAQSHGRMGRGHHRPAR